MKSYVFVSLLTASVLMGGRGGGDGCVEGLIFRWVFCLYNPTFFAHAFKQQNTSC